MSIERVGVIGAGQMGNGIAHVLSLAGFDVVLEDINSDAVDKGILRIERNLIGRPPRSDQKRRSRARDRAHPQDQSLDDMKDRDLVIEAATEDETIKRKIFQDLCTRISDKSAFGHQHVFDLGDAAGSFDRSTRNISSACIS